MNKKDDLVFEIKEFPLGRWLYWTILIVWIFFALYKFPVNPVFFSISIATAVLLLYLRDERVLVVRDETLELKVNKIFPIFNRSKLIRYSEVERIVILDPDRNSNAGLEIGLTLLLSSLLTVRTSIERKITIEYKNGDWETFKRIGTIEDNIRLAKYLEGKI